MTFAFITLKTGYETSFPAEFLSKNEENGTIEFWGKTGMVGFFPMEKVQFCCITEKKTEVTNGDKMY